MIDMKMSAMSVVISRHGFTQICLLSEKESQGVTYCCRNPQRSLLHQKKMTTLRDELRVARTSMIFEADPSKNG